MRAAVYTEKPRSCYLPRGAISVRPLIVAPPSGPRGEPTRTTCYPIGQMVIGEPITMVDHNLGECKYYNRDTRRVGSSRGDIILRPPFTPRLPQRPVLSTVTSDSALTFLNYFLSNTQLGRFSRLNHLVESLSRTEEHKGC